MSTEKAAADKATADKAATEKAAADKAAAEAKNAAALEGAKSVADAVTRVANAAVEAAKNVKTEPAPEVQFSGNPGGRFVARGSGFGPSGSVHVGGRQLKTNSWSTTEVIGEMPSDVQSGEVAVHVDDKTIKRGYYKRV